MSRHDADGATWHAERLGQHLDHRFVCSAIYGRRIHTDAERVSMHTINAAAARTRLHMHTEPHATIARRDAEGRAQGASARSTAPWTMLIRNHANIGVTSSPPNVGIQRRIGRSIHSVRWNASRPIFE